MSNNNIQAAIDAGKALASGQLIDINGVPHMMTAAGTVVTQYAELAEQPQRIQDLVKTDNAASFIEYFNRFANDHSAIFMDTSGHFDGVIDYHDVDKPAWCQHHVSFSPVPTKEWLTWTKNDGQKFSQEEFAYFIEDCAEEIQIPPAAEMLEIATTLKAKTKINFASAKSLSNGQTQLTYNEEIDGSAGAKGELKIPEKITIGMRLFKDGEAYKMEARFRYRIREGVITFWYDLIRPSKTQDAALDDIQLQIKEQVKCQLFVKGGR